MESGFAGRLKVRKRAQRYGIAHRELVALFGGARRRSKNWRSPQAHSPAGRAARARWRVQHRRCGGVRSRGGEPEAENEVDAPGPDAPDDALA